MKKNVMIRIDKQVVEKAKNLGLNISKYCENRLIQAIEALTIVSYVKEGGTGTVGSDLVARERFELSSAGPEPAMLRCLCLVRIDYGNTGVLIGKLNGFTYDIFMRSLSKLAS